MSVIRLKPGQLYRQPFQFIDALGRKPVGLIRVSTLKPGFGSYLTSIEQGSGSLDDHVFVTLQAGAEGDSVPMRLSAQYEDGDEAMVDFEVFVTGAAAVDSIAAGNVLVETGASLGLNAEAAAHEAIYVTASASLNLNAEATVYESIFTTASANLDFSASAEAFSWTNHVGSALAVYSCLRALNPLYTGPLFQLGLVGSGATLDVSTSGRYVDTQAIVDFAGSGQAYIKTLYDQSGNGHNLTSASESTAPLVYDNGLKLTATGQLKMEFDGSNDVLAASVTGSTLNDFSVFVTAEANQLFDSGSDATNGAILSFSETTATDSGAYYVLNFGHRDAQTGNFFPGFMKLAAIGYAGSAATADSEAEQPNWGLDDGAYNITQGMVKVASSHWDDNGHTLTMGVDDLKTVNHANIAPSDFPASFELRLGQAYFHSTGFTRTLNGSIQEIAILPKVTAAEKVAIAMDMAVAAASHVETPVNFLDEWLFNAGTGTTVANSRTGGPALTITANDGVNPASWVDDALKGWNVGGNFVDNGWACADNSGYDWTSFTHVLVYSVVDRQDVNDLLAFGDGSSNSMADNTFKLSNGHAHMETRMSTTVADYWDMLVNPGITTLVYPSGPNPFPYQDKFFFFDKDRNPLIHYPNLTSHPVRTFLLFQSYRRNTVGKYDSDLTQGLIELGDPKGLQDNIVRYKGQVGDLVVPTTNLEQWKLRSCSFLPGESLHVIYRSLRRLNAFIDDPAQIQWIVNNAIKKLVS